MQESRGGGNWTNENTVVQVPLVHKAGGKRAHDGLPTQSEKQGPQGVSLLDALATLYYLVPHIQRGRQPITEGSPGAKVGGMQGHFAKNLRAVQAVEGIGQVDLYDQMIISQAILVQEVLEPHRNDFTCVGGANTTLLGKHAVAGSRGVRKREGELANETTECLPNGNGADREGVTAGFAEGDEA